MKPVTIASLALGSLAGLMVFCADIANPYQNPANAALLEDKSLTGLGDSVVVDSAYVESVTVYLPELIQRYDVYLASDSDTVLVDSGEVVDETFDVMIKAPRSGRYALLLTIVKSDSTSDTLRSSVVAYSARIDRGRSLRSIRDTMTLAQAYRCSLYVRRPELAARFEAVLIAHDSVEILDSGAVGEEMREITIPAPGIGTHSVKITLEAADGYRDTLLRSFTLVSSPPFVYPDTLVRVHNRDSIDIAFLVVDMDSNLIGGQVHVTSPDTIINHEVLATRTYRDTMRYRFVASNQDTVVITAQATDRFSLKGAARCTVVVFDTIPPAITLLEPDTAQRIFTLPATVRAGVEESGVIDSVRFYRAGGTQRSAMLYAAGEAHFQVSQLDSGEFEYRVVAWDRYGNVDSISFALDYGGDQTYPPDITDSFDQTIAENGVFDTLRLGDAVQVTHPDSPYTVSELQWRYELIDDDTVLDAEIIGDSLAAVFLADTADSEWTGVQIIQFTVTDPLGFSDIKVAAFSVQPVNDTPRVTLGNRSVIAFGQTRAERSWFDTLWLDTCVDDPDDPADSLRWSFTDGNYLRARRVTTFGCGTIFDDPVIPLNKSAVCLITDSSRVYITEIDPADSLWTGTDTLTVTVEDSHGARGSRKILFSRQPLVISPGPVISY